MVAWTKLVILAKREHQVAKHIGADQAGDVPLIVTVGLIAGGGEAGTSAVIANALRTVVTFAGLATERV